MPSLNRLILNSAVIVLIGTPAALADDFTTFGEAAPAFVAPEGNDPAFIFELGLGGGAASPYRGSSEYVATFNPIIRVERLRILGIIDIGGTRSRGGFTFAPSFAVQGERKAEKSLELTGLRDIATTFEAGAKVGYEFMFKDALSVHVYGQVRYALGGAEGIVGDVGLDVTARLTPQLQITGGVSAALADEGYSDTYFGVTSAESAASGGKYDAYDPAAGIISVGAKVTAKYEFLPDTFLNTRAEYRRLVASAAESPIVKAGDPNQFIFGLGISRRFSVGN